MPEDCRYRKLDRLIDWSFVREAASPYYADEVGRPSIDPVVLVKLLVAAALEGIGSARELCRVASLRLDLRRFLGYGFYERLPVHQTLSHAQTRRFVDGALFERLFVRSLDLCKQHGLVEGSHLSVDGFHAEANAALASLRASLALVAVDEPGKEEPAEAEPPPPLSGAAPSWRSPSRARAWTLKRRSSNQTSVSRTDPDAKLRGKPGQRPHIVYRGQVAVDPKARCVVACVGEQADGYEGDGLDPILDRARFACPSSLRSAPTTAPLPSGSGGVWSGVAWSPTSRRSQRCCPRTASRPATPSTRAMAARARCKSKQGVRAHKRRMADAEGVIGELKNHHALDHLPLARNAALPRPAPIGLYRSQLQAPRRPRPRSGQRRRQRTNNHRPRPPARDDGRRPRQSPAGRPHHRRGQQRLHHSTDQLEPHRLPQLTPERPPEAVLGRDPNGVDPFRLTP